MRTSTPKLHDLRPRVKEVEPHKYKSPESTPVLVPMKRPMKEQSNQIPKYDCPFEGCHYCSTRKANVVVHMRTHTGDRPFKCTYPGCSHAFTQKISLIIHQRVHSGEKPFGCPFPGCTYRSSQKGNLKAHLKKHEVHT